MIGVSWGLLAALIVALGISHIHHFLVFALGLFLWMLAGIWGVWQGAYWRKEARPELARHRPDLARGKRTEMAWSRHFLGAVLFFAGAGTLKTAVGFSGVVALFFGIACLVAAIWVLDYIKKNWRTRFASTRRYRKELHLCIASIVLFVATGTLILTLGL